MGMHLDYFKKGKESLENKMLLCTEQRANMVGRVGCITGTNNIYALLDWSEWDFLSLNKSTLFQSDLQILMQIILL